MILPALCCPAAAKFCAYVHDGFWGGKFLIICAFFIAACFIPQSFYQVWAHICRVGSLLFIIVQSYFLLNACYSLNENVMKAVNNNTCA